MRSNSSGRKCYNLGAKIMDSALLLILLQLMPCIPLNEIGFVTCFLGSLQKSFKYNNFNFSVIPVAIVQYPFYYRGLE